MNCILTDNSFDIEEEKKNKYTLYTSMKFLQNNQFNKIHESFLELCLKEDSIFYVCDYDSSYEIFIEHGCPDVPKIISQEKIMHSVQQHINYLEKIKRYNGFNDQNKYTIVQNTDEFDKEKNQYFSEFLNNYDQNNKNLKKNKLMIILVIGFNIPNSIKQDEKELDCFKNLIKYNKIEKKIILEIEKIKENLLFKNINKTSILLFDRNNLITSDYTAEKNLTDSILSLSHLEFEFINYTNYEAIKEEDKFVLFFNRDLFENKDNDLNFKSFKKLLEQKRDNNQILDDSLAEIELTSNFYLFDCDAISFENDFKIYQSFGIDKKLEKTCIYLYYSNEILSQDYITDKNKNLIRDNLSKLNTDSQRFGSESSQPKIIQLTGHTCIVFSLIKMNNKQIISVSTDKSIRVWDIESQKSSKVIKTDFQIYKIMKLNDSSVIIAGRFGKIKICEIESGNCIDFFEQEHLSPIPIYSLCLINDNSFGSCSEDETIKIWNTNSKNSLKTLTGHSSCVWSITMMNDHNLISCSGDQTIKTWDIQSGTCLHTFNGHTDQVFAVEKVNNKVFASGSNDNTIRIWDYQSKSCIKTLLGHSSLIWSLLKIDDSTIASGSGDSTIRIWNIQSGESTKILKGHSSLVRTIEKLNEYDLVSGSDDKKIIIWRNYKKFN